jgi:hypothetical protein
VAYLIEIPVNSGGRLRIQADEEDLPGDLQLAALRPGELAARAGESLEQALDEVRPAIQSMLNWMTSLGPDEVSVEFGLVLGAETGVVIAKGTSEVHFTVNLAWKRPSPPGAER